MDEGGRRKEIADKLSELAKDAFSSLKNAKLVKGKPSKYWQVTEQIFKSNNTQNMDGGDPWDGDSIANFDQDLEGWKPVGKGIWNYSSDKNFGQESCYQLSRQRMGRFFNYRWR